jgi:UDP-N-acetylglucosamine--N-acetylmuramyl-(pentapeptide) pyrophosphoryl-undecaprenol N-acetylglucosamine transferase
VTNLVAPAADRTLLFAGGGTGGHVFPMIAVANAVKALAPDVRLVFCGTARGMETRAVPLHGYELELLDVLPLRGGGIAGFVRGAIRAFGALGAARKLVQKLAPSAVLSVGGYAAGPVSLAAWARGIPLALLEPNSVMGLANRLVAPLVKRAYTAFEETERHFRSDRVLRAGVPLRAGFAPAPYAPPMTSLRVLVLGGSQGAQALNDVVPRAVAKFGSRLSVVHQAGPNNAAAVQALYDELGLEDARIEAFIDDMPAALRRADLVIGRAGAGALSEICAVGRPSILVPYPYAAGDHQRHNADALVGEGAAIRIKDKLATPDTVAKAIGALLNDRSLLQTMAAAAQRVGRPDAANTVARDFLALAGIHVAAVEATTSDAATGSAASAAPKSSPLNGKPNGMHLVSQGVS